MSVAIEVLKSELEQQQEKLAAITEQHKDTIYQGNRAQTEVNRQSAHVNEISRAIADLVEAGRARQRRVETA